MEFEFKSNKKKVMKEADDAIARALEMIGLQAEGYAKTNLTESGAVDTGRLRGSITHATINSHSSGQSPAEGSDYATHGTPEKDEVVIGTNVEYAPHIEFGTVKMIARPYLRSAVNDHLNEYRRIILDELKN